MKRYMILAGAAAVLLLLLSLLPRRGSNSATPPAPESASQTDVGTNLLPNEPGMANEPGRVSAQTDVVSLLKGSQQEMIVRSFNETANPPVAFYGQVMDQDTNPLPNVQVGVMVSEEYMKLNLETQIGSATNLHSQTGPDGRFEVTGIKGHRVAITELAKDGYEPELGMSDIYGTYGAQSGSLSEPVVFRMWATNMHEPLIGGEKSFVVIPDGRHYAIDLTKGTIAEGDEGDLVAWIKRPAGVSWGQRYDWSCELSVPGGGLLEGQSLAMFTAPETGYTNAFAHAEKASPSGWSYGFERKRFYIKLRRGQMYGRMSVDLYADGHGKQPAVIRLSYAVNPSGSRLLR
jgi:hypothetical protein